MNRQKLRYNIITYLILTLLFIDTGGILYAQDSDQYFELAKQEGKNNNFSKALDYCLKATKLAPMDMDIREYLGKCYLEVGDLETARMVLLDVLKRSPKRVDARHYLLNIETQTKRYSSAICYVNELLEITPYSKTLWQRKINLYSLMGNRIEANRATIRLYQIFPEDQKIRTMYNNVLKEDAQKKIKSNNLSGAVKQYEKILEAGNADEETYLNLINSYLKLGNYNAALATADKGLYVFPSSQPLLDKKIGILQEQNQYHKAISTVEQRLQKEPSSHYSDMLFYLKSEAAFHYKNTDPYSLYGELYQRTKSREAYNYLLNTAMSRGYYGDAQDLLNKGLKSNPDSKELLAKQLVLYETLQNHPKAGATIEKLYYLYPQDTDIVEKYNAWSFEKAKTDYSQKNYKEALPAFLRLTAYPDYEKFSNQYLFSIYLEQQDYQSAMNIVNGLIAKYPNEPQQVFRKVDLLAAMENYPDAYELAYQYKRQHPDVPEYNYIIKELSVQYIKYLNKNEEYDKVKDIAYDLIDLFPRDMQAYHYAIGANVATGDYEDALDVAYAALDFYPKDRDLRLKLAGIYSEMGNNKDAVDILSYLRLEFPHSSLVRESLIEEMGKLGKMYEEQEEFDKAKNIYWDILDIRPKDTLATVRLSRILIKDEDYQKAIEVLDKGLIYNKNHNEMLYLKGVAYEKDGQYAEAIKFQSMYEAPANKYLEHKDHLRYLEAKMLKNQINISYLSSRTDSIPINTSVATLEYMRFEKRNTYVARLNYASRATGVGIQGEADWYHTFSNKSYFLLNAGIANQFFPELKAGLSFFQPFKKEWQGEIGIRYAKLNDERNLFTGILGIEKTYKRLWFNAKAMLMSDSEDLYHSLFAQGRFFLDNDKDYVTAMASVGTAPEDQKLDFQTNTLLSYVNTMVGAGYFRYVSHRTSFGVMGNWYNFRISPNSYINQYNLYLVVRTKF